MGLLLNKLSIWEWCIWRIVTKHTNLWRMGCFSALNPCTYFFSYFFFTIPPLKSISWSHFILPIEDMSTIHNIYSSWYYLCRLFYPSKETMKLDVDGTAYNQLPVVNIKSTNNNVIISLCKATGKLRNGDICYEASIRNWNLSII